MMEQTTSQPVYTTKPLFYARSSKPGKFYAMTIERGRYRCECPGFHHRGECRHVRDAEAGAVLVGKRKPVTVAGFPIDSLYS